MTGVRATTSRRGRDGGASTRSTRLTVLAVVLIVIGVLIMLTPVTMTWLRNSQQIETARQYSDAARALPAAQREQALAEARAWNERHAFTGAPDPWSTSPDESSPGYRDYLSQLDTLPVMARLTVPTADIDLPVHHGTSEQTLARGVGHIHGTDLPVGGAGTHAVLTGHTGISTATLFDNLIDVELGDTFTIQVLGETLTYRVDDISVVLPEETDAIQPQAGRDLVTLITCTPYGVNSHRLLVRGERIETPPGTTTEDTATTWQWWMLLTLVLCLLIVVGLTIWLLRRRKEA